MQEQATWWIIPLLFVHQRAPEWASVSLALSLSLSLSSPFCLYVYFSPCLWWLFLSRIAAQFCHCMGDEGCGECSFSRQYARALASCDDTNTLCFHAPTRFLFMHQQDCFNALTRCAFQTRKLLCLSPPKKFQFLSRVKLPC